MARFSYICEKHGIFRVSLEKRHAKFKCPSCDSECAPILKVGSSQVMERLDNGAMARAVERINNIEEIMDERSKKYEEYDDDE